MSNSRAVPTLSFENGKDPGPEFHNSYHGDKEMVGALSTGWFKSYGSTT